MSTKVKLKETEKKICKPGALNTTTYKPMYNYQLNYEIKKAVSLHQANVIIRKKKTKSDLAHYLHATCLNPTTTTFVKAIKNNNFTTWPGLTTDLVRKNLPKSMFTKEKEDAIFLCQINQIKKLAQCGILSLIRIQIQLPTWI